jgi:hypothetical protein
MGLMEIIMSKFNLPMRQAKILIEKCLKYSIETNEQDKVTYSSLNKVSKEMGLKIDISKKDLANWQDAGFQLKKLINKKVK